MILPLLTAGSLCFFLVLPSRSPAGEARLQPPRHQETGQDPVKGPHGQSSGTEEPGDDLREAHALSQRAMVRLGEGSAEQALDDLRRAMAVASGLNDSSLQASIQYRTGLVLRALGRYADALASTQLAVELADGGDPWVAALAENQAAELLNRLGRHREALDLLASAAERTDVMGRGAAEEDVLRARLLAGSGVAQSAMGDLSAAVQSFQGAARLFEGQGAEQEASVTELHLANALTQLARFREAEEIYRRVAARAEISGAMKLQGDGLSGLGLLLQYQGRQEEAQRALMEALQAHQRCGDRGGAARDLVNLAAVYLNRNDPAGARDRYQAALEIFRELGRIPDQGFARAGLARSSLLAGRTDLAATEIEAALDTLSGCVCPAERAVAQELAGRVQLEQKQDVCAAVRFRTALEIAERMGRPETVWRARAGLGDVDRRRGDLRAAAGQYLLAVEAIEAVRWDLRVPDLQAAYLYDKLDVYNALVRCLLQLNEKYAALNSLERRNHWLAAVRLERTERFESPQRRVAREKGVALSRSMAASGEELRGLHGDGGWDVPAVRGRREEQASGTREWQRFLQGLERTDPLLCRGLAVRPPDLERLARGLPGDTAVIAYFLDGDDCHVFALTAESLQVSRLTGVRAPLEDAARWMREAVQRPPPAQGGGIAREAFEQASRRLYEVLVGPLGEAVREKPRWYILPDETLWAVSFNALLRQSGTGPRYLAQDHQISVVSTLMEVWPPAAAAAPLHDPPRARVAAFGNAQGNLPAAAREMDLLLNLDPDARIFTGRDASKPRVREQARNANVLVFASHAARPPVSESAQIRLAGSDGEDGLLCAHEVRAWDLAHVDLVVLSGCGTAVSFDRERTFLALADAFLFAGARAVLATLWDVSDSGTFLFMERFVRYWKQTGDLARALSLAQTAFLQDERDFPPDSPRPGARDRYARVSDLDESVRRRDPPDLSHPYYWAPFVLLEYGLRMPGETRP